MTPIWKPLWKFIPTGAHSNGWPLTASALAGELGIVANSDGHKGRPGASYPGSSDFGAYGGLTCFLATENSRAALFESMRARHHFATTGCRLYLDVASSGKDGAVMMGDITTPAGQRPGQGHGPCRHGY